MKNATKKNIIFLAIICGSLFIIALIFWGIGKVYDWKIKEIYLFCAPLILTFIIWIIKLCISNIAPGFQWRKTLKKLQREKTTELIRISFAYLFRIHIDGKYLLVKNYRNTGMYQPVGGAYKCTEKEKRFLSDRFNVLDDNSIRIDADSENDYRMRVPIKKLKKFIKRFDNKNNPRENVSDLSRELSEELIKTKILNADIFDTIEYSYCGRHYTDICFSEYFQCYELLIADIVDLKASESQKAALRELQQKKNKDIFWACEDEIKTCGIKPGTDKLMAYIATHSFKILQCNQEKLEKNKRIKLTYIVKVAIKN